MSALANTKSRSLILVVIIVMALGVGFVFLSGDSNRNRVQAADSRAAEVPRNVKSTPGEKVTPNYAKLQREANKLGAEEAAKKGETFIPTLTGVADGFDDSDFDPQFSNDFDDMGGKCSRSAINELKSQGLSTTEIVVRLKKIGCSAAALAALFDPDELAAALLAAGECGNCGNEDAKILQDKGLEPHEIVAELKKRGCPPEDIAKGLASIGLAPDEIVAAMIKGGIDDADQIAKALSALGLDPDEIVAAMIKGGVNDPAAIASALASLGISSAEIRAALSKSGVSAEAINSAMAGITITGCTQAAVRSMQESGMDATQIAIEMKKNGCGANEIAKALKESGYSAQEIAQALKRADFSRDEIIQSLNKAGFSPVEVAAASTAIDFDDANLASLFAQQKEQQEQAELLARQQAAALEAERLANYSEQRREIIQELASAMETQKQEAMTAWSDIPRQEMIAGTLASENEARAGGAAGELVEEDGVGDVIHKAGSIFFAVLETSVNSDEPGPVMAKIVTGPLKGSRLIGSMVANQDSEKITLSFSTINIPSERASMGITAIAIDPDTARTAIATDVDHHYLLRWGSLFGSAFMEGYSSAVASAGQTQTQVQDSSGAVSTTTTSPPLDGRQQLFEGLSAIGSKWGEIVGENFDRDFTITIDQGTSVGILLTSDLTHGSPIVQLGQAVANAAPEPVATPTQQAISTLTADQTAQIVSAAVAAANSQGTSAANSATSTNATIEQIQQQSGEDS